MASDRSKLFRKESLDSLASPEQLKHYLQIPEISMWVTLIAALAAVLGLLAWGIWGSVVVTTNMKGLVQNGTVICYVSDPASVRIKMPARIGKLEGEVISVSGTPISKETLEEQYSESVVSELKLSASNYKVTMKINGAVDGVSKVVVETERMHPISFILSKGNDV